MLFSDVVFLVNVALQRGEDISLLHDILSASTFDVEKGLVGVSVFVGSGGGVLWGYGKVFELLPEDDDGLLAEQRVLRGGGTKVRGGPVQQMLLSSKQAGGTCGPIERVRRSPEEFEDVCEAIWVKL